MPWVRSPLLLAECPAKNVSIFDVHPNNKTNLIFFHDGGVQEVLQLDEPVHQLPEPQEAGHGRYRFGKV